jgi:predicted short-subunit dehydrogenase-like oxidoreductase (DUF2520 family)
MLPGMRAKPGIAIVGAGNLASALAVALQQAGYEIKEVIARSRGASLRKGQRLAREVGAQTGVIASVELRSADLRPDIVWFCVPDSEIARAARALATKLDWKEKIALHSSGALTSDELVSLRRRGARVAAVHPLMTFVRHSNLRKSNLHDSGPSLAGVPFAIEGDAAAVRMARRIVKDLGGLPYAIQKRHKAAYHAWGTFASPLFTALLATAERVAAAAGVPRHEARRRMVPILRQTLANYASFGAAGAFSGPIIRGDLETVRQHLRVLRDVPAARDAYRALAKAALRYLPAKNRAALTKALRD